MFSILNKDGEIGIMLPKELQKEFREKFNATEIRSYGAVMRDYVKVPKELHGDMETLGHYLQASYEYIMSLPSK